MEQRGTVEAMALLDRDLDVVPAPVAMLDEIGSEGAVRGPRAGILGDTVIAGEDADVQVALRAVRLRAEQRERLRLRLLEPVAHSSSRARARVRVSSVPG